MAHVIWAGRQGERQKTRARVAAIGPSRLYRGGGEPDAERYGCDEHDHE